jgi:hypothetical protein
MIRSTTAPRFDLGHTPSSCSAIQMKVLSKAKAQLG